MAVSSKREQHWQAREQLLLDCARQLIVSDGLLALQMAKLARLSQTPIGTIYKHFSSKEDLLLALSTAGLAEQARLFERAAAWQSGTRDRLFAISVADMIFVKRNPEHFRIAQFVQTEVVWTAASQCRREAHYAASQPIADAVLGIVHEAIASGELDPAGLPPEAVATGTWSMALGVHQLVHADGLLDHFNIRQPYRLLCRHVQFLLNGMRWQPLLNVSDDRVIDDLITRIRSEVFHELCSADDQA